MRASSGVNMEAMDAETAIPLARIAEFVRQHTHNVRNSLNSLELESGLLQEFVLDAEGQASTERIRRQLRSLAEDMRALSAVFQDPVPTAGPLPARDLWLIWQEKHAQLPEAPEVRWVDALGGQTVNVDAEMMAFVFRELLLNATRFSPGSPLTVTARAKAGEVIFELREPKKAAVDPGTWGQPFSTVRRTGYGLGLWAARRFTEANGATFAQQYAAEDGALTTRIVFPAA